MAIYEKGCIASIVGQSTDPIQLKAVSLVDQNITSDSAGTVVNAEVEQESNGISITSGAIVFGKAGFFRIQLQLNILSTNNTDIETWAEYYNGTDWVEVSNSGNVLDTATANETNFQVESTFVVSKDFTIRLKVRTSSGSAVLSNTTMDNGIGVPSVTVLTYEIDPIITGISIETNNLTEPLYIGKEASGNALKVETDGTWVNEGTSTTWDDVVNSLIGRRLYSNTGTIDYDYNNNALIMQDNGDISSTNDRVVFNLQYPHSAKENGMMNLHVHWEQEDTTEIEFTVQYRVQSNGSATTTAWTTVTSNSTNNNVFPYLSGTLNQITELASIDVTGAGISATVQFRFTRSDSNGGDILATFVDAHVERDMNGSRQEYVK